MISFIYFCLSLFDQVEGGFIQGLGLFTIEELRYSQAGTPWTTGPGAYKIPGFADIPVEFYVHLLRSAPNEKAVYSSKVSSDILTEFKVLRFLNPSLVFFFYPIFVCLRYTACSLLVLRVCLSLPTKHEKGLFHAAPPPYPKPLSLTSFAPNKLKTDCEKTVFTLSYW